MLCLDQDEGLTASRFGFLGVPRNLKFLLGGLEDEPKFSDIRGELPNN